MLDTVRAIETPEGISLGLRPAGPVVRAWALALDVMVRSGIMMVLAMPAAFLGSAGFGIWAICAFLLEWFYPVLFEVFTQGATPGKMAFNLRVVHADGTPVSLQASLLRNLLRFADFLPFAYGIGIVSTLADRDFRRLGDIAAGTLVVYQNRPPAVPKVAPATPLPLHMPLDAEEQRAIVAFSERAGQWNEARAHELADLLGPAVEADGAQAVTRLHGLASWLVGNR